MHRQFGVRKMVQEKFILNHFAVYFIVGCF